MKIPLKPILPALLIALLVVTACESNIVDGADEPAMGQEIVLTKGIPAPASTSSKSRPEVDMHSTLEDAEVNVGGSSTTALSVNGDYCTDFPAREVVITYTVKGNQASPASFDVYSTWDFNGTEFVGSEPTTVKIPASQGGGHSTYNVTISVENSDQSGTGSTSFVVEPFNLNTNEDDPSGKQLSTDSSSNATVHVAFDDCTPVNTPPTLTLPGGMTLEATSSDGATADFTVPASDEEDGDLSDDVVCEVDGEVVESGDTFDFGKNEVECSVTDSHGDTTSGSFFIYVQDTTAPVFTSSFPGDAELIATDIDGLVFDLDAYEIEAEDKGPDDEAGDVSGPVSISCTIDEEEADGYQIAIGTTATVTCTAEDAASYRAPDYEDIETPNTQTKSFAVFVTLDLDEVAGFFRPLRMDSPYSAHKRGSTIPHKFAAPKYADGTLATDLAEGLRLTVTHVDPDDKNGVFSEEDPARGSTAWRYDDEQYIFNAKSGRDWAPGTWETTVKYGEITLAETKFVLRR